MARILTDIDRLIRGEMLDAPALGRGEVKVDLRSLLRVGLVLGLVYGVFMGLYASLRPAHASMLAMVATTLKVPLLFLLTFLVTFPSLYVFSTLMGSKCRLHESLGLLIASMGTNLAVLASVGPITAFFTLCTDSYPFLVLLNVFFFALSGLISVGILSRSVRSLARAKEIVATDADFVVEEKIVDDDETDAKLDDEDDFVEETASAVIATLTPGDSPETPTDFDRTRSPRIRHATASPTDSLARVFRAWVIIYGIVGAQMGWILRPLIGTPDLPFAWFRPREGSFLTGLGQALVQLFR
ncbi:MAG: hypothetical protein H6807_12675 [Planctomycetes bacterium]|nr:hypothetical protein [Planctomycetota bacterium]